ncbi:MAG: hypothetical protein L3J71_10760 [Victivallaceae bacterium]|nr:hypothetical protein [Victivallaceae bacterium]
MDKNNIEAEFEILKRKHPAHPRPLSKHNQPVIIFLTVCTANRLKLLDNNHAHHALVSAWKQADAWTVGFYMIMPDHIHLFCSPAKFNGVSLKHWVVFWKRSVAREYSEIKGHWQNDFWDTQIRSVVHLQQKTEYVRNNPIRLGLSVTQQVWPYKGIISRLSW